MNDTYWYFLQHVESNRRTWALVDRPLERGKEVTADMLLGYTERIHNGSWICFVKFEGYMKCISGEPSAELAKKLIMQYYRGAVYHGQIKPRDTH